MLERKEIFAQYIIDFKKLSIESKKQEIIYSLKELLAVFDALSIDEGIKLEYLKSNEILETNTEDDFLEAILVYLEITKDVIGQYLLKSFKR